MHVVVCEPNVLDQPRGLENLFVLLLEFRWGQLGWLFPTPSLVDLQERVTNMLNKQSQNLARD